MRRFGWGLLLCLSGLACVEAPADLELDFDSHTSLLVSCPSGQFVCADPDGTLGPCGDHKADNAHCGSSCLPCAKGRVCINGLCSGNGGCPAGQFQCSNADGTIGACGDHLTDVLHCGQRCLACQKGQTCVNGACTGTSSCPSGQFVCANANGTLDACGDHKADSAHCGTSCIPCLRGQTCVNGACTGTALCPSGQFVCTDADGNRGPCGDHKADNAHCGPTCTPCGKGRTCVNGVCTGNSICPEGQFQCANADGTVGPCGDHKTDSAHCGYGCAACPKGLTCVDSVCTGTPTCGAGQFQCLEADGRLGACGDHKSDNAHCGSTCEACPKGKTCVGGVCTGTSTCPANQFICLELSGEQGACGTHLADDAHCGSECFSCAKGRSCVNGLCAGTGTCPAGQFQCANANGSVGACGTHLTDSAACGPSCLPCAKGETCVGGVCTGAVTCSTGLFQCINADGSLDSCSDHKSNAAHCGRDCTPCLAGQTCVGGVCTGAATCPAGQFVCTNADGTKGPCGDHKADDAHCGPSCLPCAKGRSCVNGVCTSNGVCPPGQFQCANPNGTVGPCSDHASDHAYCGPGCVVCQKGQTCVAGVCTGKPTCSSGQFVCRNADGTETGCSDHKTDALHCGPSCIACQPGQTCSGGVCTGTPTCPAGQFSCPNVDGTPGVCSDHLTDNARCGTSCVKCAKGRQCVNGICSGNADCGPGTFRCTNADSTLTTCSDHQSDNAHCGYGCAACAKGQSCIRGVCTGSPTCPAGTFQCQDELGQAAACGTHLTDHDHCGPGCVRCDDAQACISGVCVLKAGCPDDTFLCPTSDGTAPTCSNHASDFKHCGLSCTMCLASQKCENGACVTPPTCPAGQFVCPTLSGQQGPCGDHLADRNGCGPSCEVCARGESCINGLCTPPAVCTTPGTFICADAAGKVGPCGDHLAENAHCGPSCASCLHTETCQNGICTPSPRCPIPGQFICTELNGAASACSPHLSDHNQCGPGCVRCADIEMCVNGVCTAAPKCAVAGQYQCADAAGKLGPCTDHLADDAQCGPSCTLCAMTEKCVGGKCVPRTTCPAGQFACTLPGGALGPCGTHLTENAHCGPSCVACASGQSCRGGSCTAGLACPAGQFQCTKTDGTLGPCSTHQTDATACGPSCAACPTGKVCSAGACL